MSHARKAIREAVVAALIAAGTAAGANVFAHSYNARRTLPALFVEGLGANHSDGAATETQTVIDMSGAVERQYRLVVTAAIAQSTDAEGARDDLVAEVEAALIAATLPGVKRIVPAGYVESDDNTGEKPIRRGLQIFQVTYYTPEGDPSTTL